MTGCIELSRVFLASLAIVLCAPAVAFAQSDAELPEPGADALPSETPPPPPVPPEPPPAAPIVFQPPPAALGPVVSSATDASPPKTDLTLPFAMGSLALGGAFVLGGGITLGAAPGAEEYCTVSGCVDRERDREFQNIGADLIGAGAGFAVIGGIGMLAWADSRPRGTEQRHSVPMMTTGFSLTAFGAAGFGLGLAQTFTYKRAEADASKSWPLFFTSGLLFASGIPLWVAGANNRDATERAERAANERLLADPRVPKKRQSIGKVIGGSILVGLGGLGGLAGTVVFVGDTAAGGPSFLSAIVAAPTLGAGALLTAIGVPTILSGNRQLVATDKKAASYEPEVTAGAGSLSAAWRFE